MEFARRGLPVLAFVVTAQVTLSVVLQARNEQRDWKMKIDPL
jgi:hypothetical protein